MKKILYKIFVLCAFVVTLTGCELYMDDRDIQLGNPVADGDGYSAPATYMDSITTVTYQFYENTVYINEPYRPHIFSANVDTAAGTIEIRFAKSIPSDMMPQRGNCLASSLYDIFNDNVCHKVDVVEEADGLYVVKGHAVLGREVFKHLVVEGGFCVEGDTTQVGNDSRAGENALIRGIKLRPINHDYTGRGDSIKTEEDEEGRFNFDIALLNLDLNFAGEKFANFIKEDTKIGRSANNFFKKKTEVFSKKMDSSKIKFNAEFDGFIGFSEALVFEFNFKFDFDNGAYDIQALAYNELYLGLALTEFKGSLVLPIFGNKTVSMTNNKLENVDLKIGEFDYWIRGYDIDAPLITGIGVFDFYISPNLIAEFYAKMSFNDPIGFFIKQKNILIEYGRHKDDKADFTYGQGSHKTIKEKKDNFLKAVDEMEKDELDNGGHIVGLGTSDFAIDLGFSGLFIVEFGITYNALLNLYAQIGATMDLHYVYDNSHLYKFDVNVLDPGTGELEEDIRNLNNSYFEFAIRLSAALAGRIYAKITTIDLFKAQLTFDLLRLKYKYKPLNPPVVTFDKKRSNGKDAYFTAEVTKYSDSKWGDIFHRLILPDEAPYLAIYKIKNFNKKWVDITTSDIEFVCYVKPDESEYDIDNIKQTFNYEFKLENYDICNYLAIPYYDTPFGLKYSYASMFKPDKPFVWGEINNLEQLTIENGEMADGSQYYGFKFNVEGKGYRTSPQWYLDIEIKDKNSNKVLYTETKFLGKIDEDEIKKYIFFFEGSSPSGYDLQLILWYRDQDEDDTVVDEKELELSAWEGGETVVDIDDIFRGWDYNGYYKDYDLLGPSSDD